MKKLAILGASGHGKVVADAALLSGWSTVVFFDDAWPGLSAIGPWKVMGNTAVLLRETSQFDGAVVAIGDNPTRLAKQRELEAGSVVLVSIIHPKAVVSAFAAVGVGSVILAGAILNPFSRAGCACILNTSSSVDHDSVLGDGVHVSPGAHLGGGVRVGEAAWIGVGASVKHGVTIGAGVVVGAGAAVIADVADRLTVVGVPARSPVEPDPC